MGQRTAILLKKNYGNNRSTITLIYHQWGIGKVMPSLLLQEVLRYVYPLNRRHSYIYKDDGMPIDVFFTFEPLSNEESNYITNKLVKTDDPNEDIWNPQVRVRYGNRTDNNNGLMLVEVTQKYDKDGDPENYGDSLEIKYGFALGSEEIDIYHDKMEDWIDVEPEFVRLVSMEEYACRTFGNGDPKVQKETKKYIKHVQEVMKTIADIEEIYDKGGKQAREQKEKHIFNVIEGLTFDLPKGQQIPVPDEFREVKPLAYS